MKIKRVFNALPFAALLIGGFLTSNKDIPYTPNTLGNNTHTIDTVIAAKRDTLPVVNIPAINSDMSSMIIAIDPGHDSKYTGSRVNGVIEEDLNLIMAKKIDSLLRQEGYPTYMTRKTNSRMNIANIDVNKSGHVTNRDETDARSNYMKSVGAKLAIIVHYGTYSEKEHNGPYNEFNYIHGTEFYFSGLKDNKQMTDTVANYNRPDECKIYSVSSMDVAKKFGQYFKDNGVTARVWGSDFRILHNKPAEVTILVEFRYLTNESDFKKATTKEGREADARLLVDCINKNRDIIFDQKSYASNLEGKVK
jgi:N-acetylmuramoyl-L-alanine amidase